MVVSKQKIRETLFGLFRKEKILKYIFAAVIVWMGVYRLGELTMPIILDDEFGYWSNSMLFQARIGQI